MRFRPTLLLWIVLAIIAGIVFGLFLPESVVRVFATFNGLFGSFLTFFIPLLIVGLITPAIATLGRCAGRLLLVTAGLAYASSVLAGVLSWGTSMALFPTLLQGDAVTSLADPRIGAGNGLLHRRDSGDVPGDVCVNPCLHDGSDAHHRLGAHVAGWFC